MLVKRERENFYVLNWLDQFMMGHKGYIAGGCFKNIFNQEKVKDIDVFFENSSDFKDAVYHFDKMSTGYEGDDKETEQYRFYYENNSVKAYRHIESNIVIELCCKEFGSPDQMLNKFDFTIVKFAYYKEEVEDKYSFPDDNPFGDVKEIKEVQISTHMEYRILCDTNYFEHLHLKRLVTDNEIPYPMSTFERMIRYIKYGYLPCKETKIKIASSIQELDESQVLIGESLYDGMD